MVTYTYSEARDQHAETSENAKGHTAPSGSPLQDSMQGDK